jgi:signal transduction histidine kinase
VDPVDVEAIVRETLEIVRPMADEKGLDLRLQVDQVDWTLLSDADKIRQILLNLVGNALKFTDRGYVAVEMRRNQDGDVSIGVIDTGRGIAAQDLPRIFDAFTQIATPDLVSPPGTGLGLSISREFSRLLGGEITIESEAGAGSTFTLTLPAQAPSAV